MSVIEIEGVSKRFVLHRDRPRSFQELFLRAAHRELGRAEPFWALRDLTYSVPEGQVLGIIGENGSGKSTLLKLIARILEPTRGRIRVHAPVSALLELGAGFHPDLTGRENIYLNSSILGISRAETRRRFDEIVAFAELERFIDVPVKHYSSGMYVRLGFAVATSANPPVLLVDEILAVGDLAFQEKCMRRIAELRDGGTTIILVTHDIQQVQSLCSNALWLDHGVLRASGVAAQVIDAYRDKVSQQQEANLAIEHQALERALAAGQDATPATGGAGSEAAAGRGPNAKRWGTREVEITGVSFLDGQGCERHLFQTGQPFAVRIFYHAHQRVERPVFGLGLHGEGGMPLAGPNTMTSHFDIQAVEGRGYVDYHIEHLPLLEGQYELSVSVYDDTLKHAYDHHHRLYPFKVQSGKLHQVQGFLYIPCTWSLNGEVPLPMAARSAKEAS